eukprot:m.82950 g.82950  ORF g.82950 m.82950 type:complete len:127 (+) comp12706_c0_seq2:1095-1475(+)
MLVQLLIGCDGVVYVVCIVFHVGYNAFLRASFSPIEHSVISARRCSVWNEICIYILAICCNVFTPKAIEAECEEALLLFLLLRRALVHTQVQDLKGKHRGSSLLLFQVLVVREDKGSCSFLLPFVL